jgi:uncharacterized protein
VLILLPPSEGKAEGGRGRPVDLARLSYPGLAPARERVLDALAAACDRPDDEAAALLGLGPTQADEVGRNRRVRTAATMPAARIYTGVLYDAMDVATMPPEARRIVDRSVLIFSGLWGVVRLGDRIPPYRCSVGSNLPGLGGLAAHWRAALAAELAPKGLVIDLRSGAYTPMWTPSGTVATVRVLHERLVGGVPTRTVVSHFNKATKGRLVRDLALAGARPRTVGELVSALRDLKYTVADEGLPRCVDVIVHEL